MSSSVVSEDFVPGRKLLVHVAENGCSIEVDCEGATSVEILQHRLAPVTGVNFNEQLLICGDTRLEPQRSLAYYKLPCDGRDVFLYNRTRLLADCPPPPREVIELPEVPIPPPPSSAQSPHRLDDAVDPALKALASYERQFKHHFQKGYHIYFASQKRIELSRRLLQEQQVQERALDTARGNMELSCKMIDQSYVDFMKQFDQQQRHHVDLLTNLERIIDRLRACKLHPALQTERYKSLLDFVRQEDISRKTLEACFASHRQFQAKVLQLKPMYTELQRKVGDLFRARPSVNVRHEEDMIREHERYFQEQASILDTLRDPHNSKSQQRGRQNQWNYQQRPDINSQSSRINSCCPQFRSKYTSAEEIESTVHMQLAAAHSNDPYVDAYYHQSVQAKKASNLT